MKRRFTTLNDEPDYEIEYQSLLVSNYHLEDDDDEPVSFSVLPIQWSNSEVSNVDDGNKGKIFLHGSSDSGLQKIFTQVTAWKFDLSGLKPEVLLLSKDGRWIKLQKPRKSFQDTIKTVLITLYFLHCVKKKPRLSTASFWSNLCKDRDLSSYGFRPSHKDLLDHMPLIGEATRRDVVLARSKLLLTVLGDKPENQKLSYEEFEDLSEPGFIDDDTDNDIIDETDEGPKVEDDLFDSVCAMCDNGGDLIMCDGACMRSFHATKADGRESMCDSLGFTKKQVDGCDAMETPHSVNSPRRTLSLSRQCRATVSFLDSDNYPNSTSALSPDHGPKPSEVYGFVGSITTVVATVIFLVWAYVPESWLHFIGISYYPSRYWALAVPTYVMVTIILMLAFYIGLNFVSTPSPASLNTVYDEFSRDPLSHDFSEEGDEKPIDPISDIGIDRINDAMFNNSA